MIIILIFFMIFQIQNMSHWLNSVGLEYRLHVFQCVKTYLKMNKGKQSFPKSKKLKKESLKIFCYTMFGNGNTLVK